jgi:hypothetical protein
MPGHSANQLRWYRPPRKAGEERRYLFATFPAAFFFTALPFPSASSASRTCLNSLRLADLGELQRS